MKQAVILAGGKGTRLKSISGELPKSMVPVLGVPLLGHLLGQCVKYGILDIKLLVSFQKDVIIDYFGDGTGFGVSIEYIVEDIPRGTAGALIDALPKLNEEFLVLYGDTFFDIDLSSFWAFHEKHECHASIFLHPNDHPHDSDLVEVDTNCQVLKVHPYPHDEKWHQNLVNAAVYMFNKSAFKEIKLTAGESDIAKNLFTTMLAKQKKIYGYISTEYIKDMGTPERLLKLEKDIKSGKVSALKKDISKRAIFIDRDGTINKEANHLSCPDEFQLIEGAGEAISKINEAGILAVVVTNQPVIARGELTQSGLRVIHNKMDTLLGHKGAYIDSLYYCPHHPDGGFEGEVEALKFDCECRKPNIGLFKQAESDLNIVLHESWLVGDSSRDIYAAQKLGMRSVLVKTGYAGKDGAFKVKPDFFAKDLNEAVKLIFNEIGLNDS